MFIYIIKKINAKFNGRNVYINTCVCVFCMSVCACLIDVHLSEGDNSGWADLFDQSFKRVYPQDLATGCRKFTPNPIITSSHLTFSETQFRQSYNCLYCAIFMSLAI